MKSQVRVTLKTFKPEVNCLTCRSYDDKCEHTIPSECPKFEYSYEKEDRSKVSLSSISVGGYTIAKKLNHT
jgi:hypothetical protein